MTLEADLNMPVVIKEMAHPLATEDPSHDVLAPPSLQPAVPLG